MSEEVVQFIDGAACEQFFAKLGVDGGELIRGSRSALRFKTFDCYYDRIGAHALAKPLVAQLEDFSTCHVWAHAVIFGDRSRDKAPPPGWTEYRKWRAGLGEPRRLYDAPGHVFEAHECDMLTDLIAWAIVMGWDAWIAAKPGKSLFRLSHDDRIEIYARSQPGALLDAFATLGVTIKKRGLRRF